MIRKKIRIMSRQRWGSSDNAWIKLAYNKFATLIIKQLSTKFTTRKVKPLIG